MPRKISVELDGVFDEVGHFGRYQARLYCSILAPILFSGIYNAQYVFAAAEVNYRCVVPECESASSAQWEAGAWAEWALLDGSNCERRRPTAPNVPCEQASFGEGTQRCTAWVYQTDNSIIAEFDLACQDWKRAFVGTIHSIGVFTALFYIGALSDGIGRRKSFIMTATSCAVAGLVRSFSTSYVMYLVFEFLDAMLGAGVYTTGYILALEMVGVEKRVICGAMIAGSFAIGQMTLALVAWAFPYWRTLTRVVYTPSLFFIVYCLFLEESFRWLFMKGRTKEAIKILYKVAAVNKKTLSEATVKRLNAEPAEDGTKTDAIVEKSVFRQVVRSRIMMSRMAICCYGWVTAAFVYYGLSINSVSLSGSMYVNYMLISLVEIPGYLLNVVTLDRFGRRTCMMVAFGICTVCLLVLPFVPTNTTSQSMSAGGVTQLLLALGGKLTVSSAFNGLYVMTSELFPTPVRHRALACCSLVARVGQIIAMLTPLLLAVLPWLPFVLFGGMSGVAALLLLLTPETVRAPLPDTIAQAERLSQSPPSAAPASPPNPPHAPDATRPTRLIVDKFSRRLLAEKDISSKR